MPSQLFQGMLLEYGAVTRQALFEMLPTDREPWRHHYDLLNEYPRRGGRMLRAVLVIATTRAFGGTVEEALGAAVTAETLQTALLIHGDVFDQSERRRGGTALHRQLGVPLAINVGDTLTLMSLRPLIEGRYRVGPRITLRLVEETERMLAEYAEGRANDLTWRREGNPSVGASEFLRMILQSHAWFHGVLPVRLGALIGTRDNHDLDSCVPFGFFVASALQIRDELAGYHAGTEHDGRGDLRNDGRGFLIQDLLSTGSESEQSWLREYLSRPRDERSIEDLAELRGLLADNGCIERMSVLQKQFAEAARTEHEQLFGGLADSRDKLFLRELTEWASVPESSQEEAA